MPGALFVAEKNSVAAEISRVLSNGSCTKTPLQKYYNEYRFTYALNGQLTSVIVIHTSGHASEYTVKEEHAWGKCDHAALFQATLATQVESAFHNVVQKYLREVDSLYLMLDADREGESIAYDVIEAIAQSLARRKLPIALDIRPSPLPSVRPLASDVLQKIRAADSACSEKTLIKCHRCLFASLAQQDLTRAIQAPLALNSSMVDGVDLRRELDLKIGFAFTRLQTEYLRLATPHSPRRNFRANIRAHRRKNAVTKATFGTCQIPAIGIVYMNSLPTHKQLRTPSFDIAVRAVQECSTHEQGGFMQSLRNASRALTGRRLPVQSNSRFDEGAGNIKFSLARAQPSDIFKMLPVAQRVQRYAETHGALVISSVTATDVTDPRPQPLCTLDLQRALAGRHSAHSVLAAAERLYSAGFISYPRTETRVYSKAFEPEFFTEIIRTICKQSGTRTTGSLSPELIRVLEYCKETFLVSEDRCSPYRLPNMPRGDSKRCDNAHSPIHPLKLCDSFSTLVERDVYLYVLHHFLASVSEDCILLRTEITASLDSLLFAASETAVKRPGYRAILYAPTASPHAPHGPLFGGTVAPGTKLSIISVVLEKRDGPESFGSEDAPHMSERDLLTAMDTCGIGTDATMADHISTLLDRRYLECKSHRYTCTPLGTSVVGVYRGLALGAGIIGCAFRALVEYGGRCIADGSLTPERVCADCIAWARGLYDDVRGNSASVVEAFRRGLACIPAAASPSGPSRSPRSSRVSGTRRQSPTGPASPRHKRLAIRGTLACCGQPCRATAIGGLCRVCNQPWHLPSGGRRYRATGGTCPRCDLTLVSAVSRHGPPSPPVCLRCGAPAAAPPQQATKIHNNNNNNAL